METATVHQQAHPGQLDRSAATLIENGAQPPQNDYGLEMGTAGVSVRKLPLGRLSLSEDVLLELGYRKRKRMSMFSMTDKRASMMSLETLASGRSVYFDAEQGIDEDTDDEKRTSDLGMLEDGALAFSESNQPSWSEPQGDSTGRMAHYDSYQSQAAQIPSSSAGITSTTDISSTDSPTRHPRPPSFLDMFHPSPTYYNFRSTPCIPLRHYRGNPRTSRPRPYPDGGVSTSSPPHAPLRTPVPERTHQGWKPKPFVLTPSRTATIPITSAREPPPPVLLPRDSVVTIPARFGRMGGYISSVPDRVGIPFPLKKPQRIQSSATTDDARNDDTLEWIRGHALREESSFEDVDVDGALLNWSLGSNSIGTIGTSLMVTEDEFGRSRTPSACESEDDQLPEEHVPDARGPSPPSVQNGEEREDLVQYARIIPTDKSIAPLIEVSVATPVSATHLHRTFSKASLVTTSSLPTTPSPSQSIDPELQQTLRQESYNAIYDQFVQSLQTTQLGPSEEGGASIEPKLKRKGSLGRLLPPLRIKRLSRSSSVSSSLSSAPKATAKTLTPSVSFPNISVVKRKDSTPSSDTTPRSRFKPHLKLVERTSWPPRDDGSTRFMHAGRLDFDGDLTQAHSDYSSDQSNFPRHSNSNFHPDQQRITRHLNPSQSSVSNSFASEISSSFSPDLSGNDTVDPDSTVQEQSFDSHSLSDAEIEPRPLSTPADWSLSSLPRRHHKTSDPSRPHPRNSKSIASLASSKGSSSTTKKTTKKSEPPVAVPIVIPQCFLPEAETVVEEFKAALEGDSEVMVLRASRDSTLLEKRRFRRRPTALVPDYVSREEEDDYPEELPRPRVMSDVSRRPEDLSGVGESDDDVKTRSRRNSMSSVGSRVSQVGIFSARFFSTLRPNVVRPLSELDAPTPSSPLKSLPPRVESPPRKQLKSFIQEQPDSTVEITGEGLLDSTGFGMGSLGWDLIFEEEENEAVEDSEAEEENEAEEEEEKSLPVSPILARQPTPPDIEVKRKVSFPSLPPSSYRFPPVVGTLEPPESPSSALPKRLSTPSNLLRRMSTATGFGKSRRFSERSVPPPIPLGTSSLPTATDSSVPSPTTMAVATSLFQYRRASELPASPPTSRSSDTFSARSFSPLSVPSAVPSSPVARKSDRSSLGPPPTTSLPPTPPSTKSPFRSVFSSRKKKVSSA